MATEVYPRPSGRTWWGNPFLAAVTYAVGFAFVMAILAVFLTVIGPALDRRLVVTCHVSDQTALVGRSVRLESDYLNETVDDWPPGGISRSVRVGSTLKVYDPNGGYYPYDVFSGGCVRRR